MKTFRDPHKSKLFFVMFHCFRHIWTLGGATAASPWTQIISQNSLPYLTLCCGGTSCPPGMAQEGHTSCPKTQGQERTLEEIGPHSAWNHNHWETKREQEHFLRSTYCLSRLLILKAIWKNLSGIPQALWNCTGWNFVTMWHGDLVKEKWRPTGGVYAKPTNRAKSLTLRCSRLRITL